MTYEVDGWTDERRELLGVVGVDSGRLLVADPSYIRSEDALSESPYGREGQLDFNTGAEGAGVIFQAGLGDGLYEVWATKAEVEGWGTRIVKVEVLLITKEGDP